MKSFILILIICFPFVVGKLPDWLVKKINYPVDILNNAEEKTLMLTNGVISRTFLLSPGFATIDYYSHEKNSSVLRALNPEVLLAQLILQISH